MNKYNRQLLLIFLLLGFSQFTKAQGYWENLASKPSTLGLEEGIDTYKTKNFILKLVKASQTVAGLSPAAEPGFDFTPGDRLEIRGKDGLYWLGDLNFRIKNTSGEWVSYSTASARKPVTPLEASAPVLAAADLSATLPDDLPVHITRYYEDVEGDLVLRFRLKNTSETSVELGALGIPMAFNNILEGKSLDETHAQNVFFDPYIGEGAGYLEVKRLSGVGSGLLVLPAENMPFEAYRPLNDDPSPRSVVFEGFHEWMAHSEAYAEQEWKGVEQWNEPTSTTLKPGESKDFALKIVPTTGVRGTQQKLIEEERPMAIGVPGYVLPQDVRAQLFLKYPKKVASLRVEPEGALIVTEEKPAKNGFVKYSVQGKAWGRARLTIVYADGLKQTVNYKVIKPETEVVKDFGHFLTTEQWFDEEGDIFQRNPSVISYDYETKRQITQDSRAWVAGLSDEGGAGSYLGAMMKQVILPDAEEIHKMEAFIDGTLWGVIQDAEGDRKYAVKKSIFYYEPDTMPEGTYSDTINWKTWAAWNKEHADDRGRSYNYPHVAATHWVMYRLGRYHKGLVTNHSWDWYLKSAYGTAVAMIEDAPYYAQFGQMEGSVFLFILKDLQKEGYAEMAQDLETRMKARADHWKSLNYPFGSEMPWDSTGQEEVFMWSDYFGYDAKAQITLDAILAYMPTIPHWGYNGNARRYWDFLYGGKLSRVERQIHHYGSGLNAIPVLTAYRENPDLYLLRVGYGGTLGAISNITQDGFGPSAFHSYPSTLRIDYHSGDYGPNFYGYAINTATYLTEDADLGWLAFGGNLNETKKEISVEVTTAAKNRIFIQPEELWITLEAGKVAEASYNKKNGEVSLTLMPKDAYTPFAYISLTEGFKMDYPVERGMYKVPLGSEPVEVTITKQP